MLGINLKYENEIRIAKPIVGVLFNHNKLLRHSLQFMLQKPFDSLKPSLKHVIQLVRFLKNILRAVFPFTICLISCAPAVESLHSYVCHIHFWFKNFA
jgi:hypothetical protein